MWILNPLLWDFVNFGFRIESMHFCFFLSNESFGFLLVAACLCNVHVHVLLGTVAFSRAWVGLI